MDEELDECELNGHEIESFPGNRWGIGRCKVCGYEPTPVEDDE